MKQAGFTLLEMLFVLMIVMILSFIAVPVAHDAYVDAEINRFFRVLDSDILFIQNQALSGRNLSLYLHEDHYLIYENKQKAIETRAYPKAFYPQHFISVRIEYWNTGTVKEPTSYIFRAKNDRKYKMIFPFGKGRHYIEEI